MPTPFTQSTDRIALVNTYLDAFLNRKVLSAREVHPRYETLWREIARVTSHGKRLRPAMVLLSYEAFGGIDPSRIVPAAAACELLHISMLVHDDIIDRDLTRHGVPTIQGAYETRYAIEVEAASERAHIALSAALLAGDLLLSEARSMITKVEADDELIRQASLAFDQAVFEVAGGELLDVESAVAPRGSVDALTIMAYKTASYSFIGPLLIGAILAGATAAQQRTLRSFALNLGIAYQLADDILGIFGNPKVTGKSNDGDIHEGKATYMVERFYALAAAEDVTVFQRYYGQPNATNNECETIRELLRASGAYSETERAVHSYRERAIHDLTELKFEDMTTARFMDLVTKSTERSS